MVNSREKGKRGERELSSFLNGLFQIPDLVRRGQQYNGLEGSDNVGLDGIHIETKRVEKLNLEKAMEQSILDSCPDEVPIVCHRRNGKDWLVTFQLSDLLTLSSRVLKIKETAE